MMTNRRVFVGVLLAALATAGLWWALGGPAPREQASYPSPDGKYRVVVYRIPRRFAMPGQGGDAAGLVRLVDASGRALRETRVELVREVQPPEWSPRSVRIPMIVEWPLPE
jgi:hypothetical protein